MTLYAIAANLPVAKAYSHLFHIRFLISYQSTIPTKIKPGDIITLTHAKDIIPYLDLPLHIDYFHCFHMYCICAESHVFANIDPENTEAHYSSAPMAFTLLDKRRARNILEDYNFPSTDVLLGLDCVAMSQGMVSDLNHMDTIWDTFCRGVEDLNQRTNKALQDALGFRS